MLGFVHHFADPPEYQVQVVINLVDFLNLVTSGYNLLLKVDLELFDDSPLEHSQSRNVLHQEVHFLLTLGWFLVFEQLKALLLVDLENVALVCHDFGKVAPGLAGPVGPEPEVLIDLHEL